MLKSRFIEQKYFQWKYVHIQAQWIIKTELEACHDVPHEH
jgi:hypothetical protein